MWSLPLKLYKVDDNSVLGKYQRVVYVEEFHEVLHNVHERDLLHAGYKKIYEKVPLHETV